MIILSDTNILNECEYIHEQNAQLIGINDDKNRYALDNTTKFIWFFYPS